MRTIILVVCQLLFLGVAFASFEMFRQASHPEEASLRAASDDCEKRGGKLEYSARCIFPGSKYQKNKQTQCECVSFFRACCFPASNTTTTTSRPGTTTTTSTTTTSPNAGPHPLDPLSASEVQKTKDIIEASSSRKRQASTQYIYKWITLKEPEKSLMLPYFLSNTEPEPGAIPRKSFTLATKRGEGGTVYEIVTNLDDNEVESIKQVDGVQSPYTPEEIFRSEEVVRADATVAARCAALGYPDMNLVNADVWSMGLKPEKYAGKKMMIIYLYGKNHANDNQYAHPFDFIVIYDVDAEKIIEIQELPTHEDSDASNKVGNKVPRTEHNYDYRERGGNDFLRKDDKPITVSSPKGPSFKVEGNEIEWQTWKMRVGFNGREGMIIHTVSYNDNGTYRPILYRASLAEMFIPYGDPRDPYHEKSVFDLGEYGIGFNCDKQKLGEDVLGAAHFWDGVLNNSTGDAILYPSVVSVREEDAGILWKHVDYRSGKGVVTRSHRLCLSFIATVTNYEYIYNWCFYQDGSIEFKVQMTGILSINLLAEGATPAGFGTQVAPQLNAQYHQHFFAIRLDTEIDGNQNSVYTSDSISLPYPTGSKENPYGQGFTTNKTLLKTASQAMTDTDAEHGRVWLVSNDKEIHPYTGKGKAWKLMPSNAPGLLMHDDSPLKPRASCFDKSVWVMPYKEDQIFPCGFYLNSTDGLKQWVDQDPEASTENTDVVLFHIFGLTHIPRVEDFPVMPVEQTGFWFKPYSFFLQNPGLDVPPAAILMKKDEL